MSVVFDRIVIAVPDLRAAVADYELLLGVSFHRPDASGRGDSVAWAGLKNTTLELQEQNVTQPLISGIVLASEQQDENVSIDNSRDLTIELCDGSATRRFESEGGAGVKTELKVDHLVLHTADANACVELFETQLGLRLALDKDMPQWGGRMLFFRSGKLTLEVIEPSENKPERDYFWGIAYQCADIDQFTARLNRQQVTVSAVREGRKPQTKVATIKSHHLGIPTLLLAPAS